MARVRPSPLRRLAARLVTGPLGFLAAGTVDWLVLACRYLRARARGRRHDWYAQ
jgi:hypothetical protein